MVLGKFYWHVKDVLKTGRSWGALNTPLPSRLIRSKLLTYYCKLVLLQLRNCREWETSNGTLGAIGYQWVAYMVQVL